MAELEFDQDKIYSSDAFRARRRTTSSLSGTLAGMGVPGGEKGANILLVIFSLFIIAFAVYLSWTEPDPVNTIELIPGESVGVFL